MIFLNRTSKVGILSTPDFAAERQEMVKKQLANRDITDRRVLGVIKQLPRERFVPRNWAERAYEDGPLPIGEGQTISQPYMVALMTQLLQLKGSERVLEVGTGSGYQTAVLARLARRVYTIERHRELLMRASKVFQTLGLDNIETKVGDGSKGWSEQAPFDAIMVTAAAKRVPPTLVNQLSVGGYLVAPVGRGYWQRLVRIAKKKDKMTEEDFGGCAFVPLVH